MDAIAVIDTETTALFDFSKPANAEGQPRLACLGIITLALTGTRYRIIDAETYYVWPDGWSMPEEATQVNGITTEFLRSAGDEVGVALDRYEQLIMDGYVISAYNSQFDTKIMRGAFRRAERPDYFEQTPNVCLMRACTEVCQVPRKKGKGFKFPTLQEACDAMGVWLPDAHSAMGDCIAAAQILIKLQQMDRLPESKVHYAKQRPVQEAL